MFSTLQLTINPTTSGYGWNMQRFQYDAYGNISFIEGYTTGASRRYFKYDYSQPMRGMLAYYTQNDPLTLMEYMELINLPMHHKLIEIYVGAYLPGSGYYNETFPVRIWDYQEHVIADGLLYSYTYSSPLTDPRFYTGWECEAAAALPTGRKRSSPTSLEEFKALYPQAINRK